MEHSEENHKFRFRRGAKFFLIGILFALVSAVLYGAIVMLLWNWLMPTLFHFPSVEYCQAVGLVLLSHLLFKSGFKNFRGGHCHSHRSSCCGPWGKKREETEK